HDGGPGFVSEVRVGVEHAPEIFYQVLAQRRRFPPLGSGRGRRGTGEPADGFAQTADHDAHQHERELRISSEGGLKLPVVEPDDAASRFRRRCPGARRLVDRSHLAEDLAGPDRGHGSVPGKYADFAVEKEVHAVRHEQKRNAPLVLGEDLLAFGEGLGSACEAEKLHRDRSVVVVRGTALADHLLFLGAGGALPRAGGGDALGRKQNYPPGMSSGRVHFSHCRKFVASATTPLRFPTLRHEISACSQSRKSGENSGSSTKGTKWAPRAS